MYLVGKCRLNKILRAKKMTQSDLAEKLNMSRQQIHTYASSERIMTIKTAKNIASILDVSIDDLYDFVWSNEQ